MSAVADTSGVMHASRPQESVENFILAGGDDGIVDARAIDRGQIFRSRESPTDVQGLTPVNSRDEAGQGCGNVNTNNKPTNTSSRLLSTASTALGFTSN